MTNSAAPKRTMLAGGEDFSAEIFGGDLVRLQGDEAGFTKLARFLKTECGIDLPLTPKNLSLMASRMRKVLANRKLSTYKEFSDLLERRTPDAMKEFVQALTTNTTHFFREGEHFEHLKRSLPAMIEAKKKAGGPNELRVWCAAASTGQEPYTILMTILESGVISHGWNLKFLATDIDLQVLRKAARGVYRHEEVENIPSAILSKYFESVQGENGEKSSRMKKEIASMIRFAPLNLIESWPFANKFDVIFCRNVLIYFDGPTAQNVVERQAQQLNPDGLLYLGHSEMGHAKTKLLKNVAAAVYQPAQDSKSAPGVRK